MKTKPKKSAKHGDLRVWWIPQIPGEPFEVMLNSFAEAWVLLRTLAAYDLFQYHNNIKPDYSNAGGLMIEEDGEFTDWTDEDSGEDLEELTLAQAVTLDRDWYNTLLMEAANSIR